MDPNQFENDIPSDALDAMADMAYEQEEAMRESDLSDWDGFIEILIAERKIGRAHV